MSTIEIQIDPSNVFDLISFALLFYDYFLTFGLEVSRYWGTGVTAPNVLFFLNRYGMLLGTIPVVFQDFWSTPGSPEKIVICSGFETYHQYFILFTQVVVGAMLILRTYALYERNKRILVLMLLVGAGVIAVGIWSVLSDTSSDDDEVPVVQPYIGCTSTVTDDSQTLRLAAAWGGMGVFDCTIFFLTLYRALSRRRARGLDLVTVLLRDGSIYFGVMVLANLANILSFLFAGPETRGIPTTFTNVISSLMLTRLMLNLRDPTLSSMSGRVSGSATLSGDGIFSTYLSRSAPSEPDPASNANPDEIELTERVYP